MPELPWVKWFPSDWASDPNLSMCDVATQGVWMNAVNAMMLLNQPRISGTIEELCKPCRCRRVQLEAAIAELKAKKVGTITEHNGCTTLECRRLIRELKLKELKRKAGAARWSTTRAEAMHAGRAEGYARSEYASASASSVQGEGVEGGQVICLFKKLQQELNGMFGRKPECHWTNYEETSLLEITRTGSAETELQELKAYRGLNGKYFPKSVKSLLENWQTTLDQSRTYHKPQDQKTPEDRRWEREMERNKRDIERMGLAE